MLQNSKRARSEDRPRTAKIELSEEEANQILLNDSEDKEEKSEKYTIAIQAKEHRTNASFENSKLSYTFNLISNELSISAVGENGSGFFCTHIDLKQVLQRVGASITIEDKKSTSQALNIAKQLEKIDNGTGMDEEKHAKGRSEEDVERAASAAPVTRGLREAISTELKKLTQYGFAHVVVANHDGEKAKYVVNLARGGNLEAPAIRARFVSVETDGVTGTVTIYERDLLKQVLHLAKVSEDDDDAAQILRSASVARPPEEPVDSLRVGVVLCHTTAKITVDVELPKDDFTENASVLVRAFNLIVAL
jgi:hypothetical protein